ncbi:GNAT family N-acetyltransferase [Planotetraspora silvatica]|uniref:GNAT family N-acetyltransferase n=1 Tax=Planotetraspora silvatica TaxID=234614 RepID=UPI001EF22601
MTGVIWDERRKVAIGQAGYHGPPDQSGMAEVGYAVDPACRRRGYARPALETLLQRAAGSGSRPCGTCCTGLRTRTRTPSRSVLGSAPHRLGRTGAESRRGPPQVFARL